MKTNILINSSIALLFILILQAPLNGQTNDKQIFYEIDQLKKEIVALKKNNSELRSEFNSFKSSQSNFQSEFEKIRNVVKANYYNLKNK